MCIQFCLWFINNFIRIGNSFKISKKHIAYNMLYKVHFDKLQKHWNTLLVPNCG